MACDPVATRVPETAESLEHLRRFLVAGRNTDGGWGYYPGKSSRLEPTCWALLALDLRAQNADALRRWPTSQGLLQEARGGQPNYGFHALGLLTLVALNVEHETRNGTIAAAMEGVKGVALSPARTNRQDNSLQGWSWIADTFSWVEPTAWCLLASKRWARVPGATVNRARIDVAERLLLDRCCVTGGWNYGNSNMLGRELKPYIPTTAVALLAMQDRASEPAVARSAKFLQENARSEPSGMALALALMALRALGRQTAEVASALERQVATTIALNNQLGAALALHALGTDRGHSALAL